MFLLHNTEFSMSIAESIRTGDFSRVVSASVDPKGYTNADTFGRDYHSAEMMSKYPNWDLGIDRRAVALAKFLEAETLCKDTNRRLLTSLGRSTVGIPAHPLLLAASRKIERLLGEFSWPEVFQHSRWGPGASTRLGRARRDVYYKFRGIPHVTHDLFPIARKMVATIPGWDVSHLECVIGNRVTTVPKNAKTDRVIAIEPDLNMVIQLGLGGMIRKRLNRVGLLTEEAQQNNAELAKEGSLTGRFATIDLSMASDTVSYELVRTLLPARWFEALEQSRSPSGVLPSGEQVVYQKFSSMGNGYTFELETLIFWALSSAVLDLYGNGRHQVLVYGDDIIVPTQYAEHLMEVIRMVGFIPNTKKSFLDGPFRESCGKHYFLGADVTPFYVRKSVDCVYRRYWLANSVKRWSKLYYGLDGKYEPVYREVVRPIPKVLRFTIPDGFGDGGLVVDFDEAVPPKTRKGKPGKLRASNGLEGYRYRYVSKVNPKKRPYDQTLLLKALYDLEQKELPFHLRVLFSLLEDCDVEGARDTTVTVNREKYRISDAVAPQWSHFGPWLV